LVRAAPQSGTLEVVATTAANYWSRGCGQRKVAQTRPFRSAAVAPPAPAALISTPAGRAPPLPSAPSASQKHLHAVETKLCYSTFPPVVREPVCGDRAMTSTSTSTVRYGLPLQNLHSVNCSLCSRPNLPTPITRFTAPLPLWRLRAPSSCCIELGHRAV
jgi:hypothetical protein